MKFFFQSDDNKRARIFSSGQGDEIIFDLLPFKSRKNVRYCQLSCPAKEDSIL